MLYSMKSIYVFIIVYLLISTGMATNVMDVPKNLTTEENAMYALNIARLTGMATMSGKVAAYEYDKGLLPYGEYQNITNQANSIIRRYNHMLETLFNESTVRKQRLNEFSDHY